MDDICSKALKAATKKAKKSFAVGDRVRLTGKFLRNTGQMAGGEGRKVWTVVKAPDDSGGSFRDPEQFTAVDEPSDYDPSRPRFFATPNLEKK